MASPSGIVVAGGFAAAFAGGALAVGACWLLSGRRGPGGARRLLLRWTPLVLLWGLFAWIAVMRFTGGLAATTNLSDDFPWGIWVAFDILCGVATAAGGFLTAGSVYVFGLKRFYPVLRPAVLTAFLGYLLVTGGLVFDLGRPYNIWHPLVHWQHRSVLFEVAWCVSLYSTVLALEFMPILLERLGWKRALGAVRSITIPVVIAGVVLSTLHQSSLGALFLIVPHRLLPLWYTPLLPLFFFLSAAAVGFAMIVFESSVSSRAFGREPEVPVYGSALRVFAPLCAVFLVLRFVDVTARGAWIHVIEHPFQGFTFATETALLALPVAVLLRPRWTRSHRAIFLASCSVILGVVLNRLDVGWIGLLPASATLYLPSWQEVVVSLGLLSVGVVLFGLAARYLPLFEHGEHGEHAASRPADRVRETVSV
jgi:Ni/Fe-hydrogenase subunit HybB-like protein